MIKLDKKISDEGLDLDLTFFQMEKLKTDERN